MTQPPLPSMPAAQKSEKKTTRTPPPQYDHFTTFVNSWLLPVTSVRLAESNREGTYTWCTRWWMHRSVSVRFAHLHRAFELARRGQSISTFMLGHVDPHMKWILDAANGPLHRCTRAKHVALPPLSAEPVPPGKFPTLHPAPEEKNEDGDGSEKKKPPPVRYSDVGAFVNQWLLPVTAVRIVGQNREGTYTWCPCWWEHLSVVIRFAALHKSFEAARVSDDLSRMSSLFVKDIDPQMRYILDASKGPLYACTPTRHIQTPGLACAESPWGWFDLPGEDTAVEDLGFGPDFRLLATFEESP